MTTHSFLELQLDQIQVQSRPSYQDNDKYQQIISSSIRGPFWAYCMGHKKADNAEGHADNWKNCEFVCEKVSCWKAWIFQKLPNFVRSFNNTSYKPAKASICSFHFTFGTKIPKYWIFEFFEKCRTNCRNSIFVRKLWKFLIKKHES